MQVAAIFGPQRGGIVEKPMPMPKDDIVVVKVHTAPMCTEYHQFKDGHPGDSLGHEAVGEVVAVDRSNAVRVGDRVVVQPLESCGKCYLCVAGDYIHCENPRDVLAITGSEAGTGTMAQYLLKSDRLLTPIPDGMSYDHAAMACCGMGPTFGAMQLMQVDAFDTVLITGMGPVGLGGVVNARYRGARVIAVESHPYRAALARTLGAVRVIDPRSEDAVQQVMDATGGIGADRAIDTSGTEAAKGFLVDAVRRKGKIALVGWSGQLDASSIIRKGLSIFGAWHYNLRDAGRLLQAIERSGPQIDQLVTHTFPLSRVQDAWELQMTGNCGKVLLKPWEG